MTAINHLLATAYYPSPPPEIDLWLKRELSISTMSYNLLGGPILGVSCKIADHTQVLGQAVSVAFIVSSRGLACSQIIFKSIHRLDMTLEVVLGQCTSGWGWCWASAHQVGGGAGPVHIRLGVGAGPVHIRLGWGLGQCTPGWGWGWASAHQVGGGAGPVHIRLGVGLGQCTSGWGGGWASAHQVGGGAGPVHIRLGVGLGQCTSGWGWGWASAHSYPGAGLPTHL